jgi:hypothetical protein
MWEKESAVTRQAAREAGEILTGLFGNGDLKGYTR